MELPNAVLLIPVFFLSAGCTLGGGEAATPARERLEGTAPGAVAGGTLEIIPEYETSTGLLVSHYLAQRQDKLPFLLKVLESFDLYVLMPRENKGREDPRLAELFEAVDRLAPGGSRDVMRSRIHPFANDHPANYALSGARPWARSIWARDWGPLSARREKQGEVAYLDFDYSRVRAYENTTPRGFVDFLRASADPEPGGAICCTGPVSNSLGNFMIGGDGHGMLTEAPLRMASGDLERVFRESLGCRRISVFESMPHEETGHIDMWGKFLDRDTVLVSAMEDRQRQVVPEKQGAVFDDIQAYLDERAREIEGMGYRVIRIPNPVPVFKGGQKLMLRSYANSLLLAGEDGRRFAFVPRYREPAVALSGRSSSYPDADLLEGYEGTVAGIFASAGYEVMFVPADDLIVAGGAIHCVGMQVR